MVVDPKKMMQRYNIGTMQDATKLYKQGEISQAEHKAVIDFIGRQERKNADIGFVKDIGVQTGKSLLGGATMAGSFFIPNPAASGAVFGAGHAIANDGNIGKEATIGGVTGGVFGKAVNVLSKTPAGQAVGKAVVNSKVGQKVGEVLNKEVNQLIKPQSPNKQVLPPQVKTNPNAVKIYDYEPKKLPTAGEYDLTSIEGMKNIQDKGLRDLLSQGDTEVQTYYHGSPNPNIDVLDPSFNERGLYGKGTYLANRSSEAVDQGMGNTLYTVETPHNQYLMDYYTSVGKQGGIPKYLADKLGLPENTVGGELYDALVERLGSKEAASKLLDDMGVKGHVVRFSDGNKYKVLYDKDSARIIDKYTRGQ